MSSTRIATLLSVPVLIAACAGSPVDTATGVRSMCAVPFAEGETVHVSGVFAGDRHHYSIFYDPMCQGKVWEVALEERFLSKYGELLEITGPKSIELAGYAFKIEVEGRLYLSRDAKAGIEFQELGRIVERLKEPA